MSKLLIQCVFLVVWFVHLDCEIHQDRPRIKTENGDLVIEPAFDKNIHLRPNGPKSSIYVGGVNLLNMNISSSDSGQIQTYNNNDLDKALNGPNGILQRLERLESRQLQPDDVFHNITVLWRRINRLTTRISNLQLALNDRGKDECVSRPCLNGGTCLNLYNGYYCLCPSNWEGKNCDVDVNECRNFAGTDLGCQNGATCKNLQGSYECECRSGWYGVHCTRRAKDCNGGNFEMCGHGTCISVDTGEGIKCICDQGWTTNGTGVACLTDVNECDSSQGARCSINPTVECVNTPGSFRCGQCPAGYEGDGYTCSDIDECLTIPNGGCSTSPFVTCHNTIGSRICGACPVGYQGDGISCTWRGSCAINRGGCHPSAQCMDNPALGGQMAICICPPGLEGDGVGLNGCYVPTGNSTRGCETNPCGVHGQCHPLRTGYTCICYRGYGGAYCSAINDYCGINPCMNGGRCRQDESTARGFRCECTAQYSGDLCHVAAKTCGGLLQNEEGSIIYPFTNTTYNHNSRCAWVIQVNRDKVINVTFSKFDLEDNYDCLYDFLQIHDGRSSASQLIGRFCGKEYPKGGNIISTHNNLYFWFKSDQTVAKNGFALHWTSINPVCGGEIDATQHGQISSPGSPGNYPPNRDCYWHLSTTYGKRIQLQFFALDIEAHSNCSFDYLAIYDGERSTDPLISKFCNSTHPAPIQSAGSNILLHFHSDAYSSGRGFQITFAPADGVPGCGGFYSTEVGEIVSPSYNGRYMSHMLCEYKIKTSPDTKIELKFNSFKLERSFRCNYDYLKVYDGPTEESRLAGKFCGSTYPQTFTSSSNQMLIIFRSDASVSAEGFRISYVAVCQQTILEDSGIVKSPGYPSNYPVNRVCEYIIGTTPGKAIQLSFQDFDIEDNAPYNCLYDSLEIRDGANVNATLLGKYCGGISRIPGTFVSKHNYLYMKFKSDISLSGTGFYANYTSIPVACGGIYTTTTGLIRYPSGDDDMYSNDQTCTWLIFAPRGMHIKLSWNRFDLENMPSCRSDYVELMEIDENNESNTLGKYCGTTTPPMITTTSNKMQIKFVSDSSVRSTGFSLSYTFLDGKLHCAGTYTKAHGFLYSPGWPKKYENNRDCRWIIRAPAGQQVRLNISQFQLEEPIRNICDYGDYLEIRNGATQSSPLIGKYCGHFKSKRIISIADSLYLHFHSDSYLTGGGFQIEWDSAVTGCGGTLSGLSGFITSPNYPDNYHENAECFYKIVTSAGSQIRINFSDLELERTPSCRDDYVELFDGLDENSPSLGKYCYMVPEIRSIKSTSNNVFIKFRSDFYIGAKGFSLQYTSICQNNLTGFHGIIESPGYPDHYGRYLNCLWTINVPKGNMINVTFTEFDIYRPYRYSSTNIRRCDPDFLQIKETSDVDFGEKLCGSVAPSRFSSRSNSLQIKFATGFFVSLNEAQKGFRLEWARSGCGGTIIKRFGTIKVDRSLSSSGELECEWMIQSPFGTSVTLDVTDNYMSDSPNCTIDALELYNGQSTNDPLLSKICHRGTTSVTATSNFMLVRFVKRSTLKDVYFTSHYTSFQKGCGDSIEALSGFIYSKNYPKNYDNDLNCLWIIHVPSYYRIELNFMVFDLYSLSSDDSECADSVKIYDGEYTLNSNYTQLLCPNSNTSQIISKYNTLGLLFHSDNYGTAKGFKANFTVTCGSTITATYDGIININSWHVSHISNNCTWTIKAPTPDKKISLTITHLSLSKNTDIISNRKCPSNFLRVYDGDDDKAPVIEEYCGQKIPPMIVSQGSAITIVLGSYNGTVQGKFTAHYSSLLTACGGSLSSEEGTIASPNYPKSYPVGASCEWTLNTSPGNRVYITFEQFDLETSENCNEDYLEVREENGAGRLIGVYCGSDVPTNTTVGSKLYIKFHSDNKNSGRGFVIHYGFLHGNQITGLERGDITSPLFPNPYVGAGEYSWRISVEGSKVISINLDRMEIPTHGSTCYNSLKIYDGYNNEAPLLDESCGMLSELKEMKSTSNVVFLKLNLDDTNSGSVFHLRWTSGYNDIDTTQIDNDRINCGSNETESVNPGQIITLKSPGYPTSYTNDLNCEWVFKATDGHRLNLHFKALKIEQTPMCFADYISVYSSDTPALWKPVKENMCLTEQTNKDFNSSNYMKIVFHTDSSISREGFEAQLSSLCGGSVRGLSGVIGPTWNDTVGKMSVKCDWTIKVRPGRVVTLTFEHFNITNTNNDCRGYVILRNGDSSEAPLLADGKYCGYEHEKRLKIESSSNAVYVRYISNIMGSPRAFQTFRLRFEEKGVVCGSTSTLDADQTSEIINSPNYPSVPVPYTECVWIFTAPPGEILRIDFIDRFDLDSRNGCSLEYVEIRDGGTDLAPMKGRYCRDSVSTIKTSSNIVYIKYSTQVAEPRNGFKANISLDFCGGTIKASKGEVVSPGYPHMRTLPPGSNCEWRIIGMPRQEFLIKPQDIHLPSSESHCGTKITIEEPVLENKTIAVLQTFCSDTDTDALDMSSIETSSNNITIRLSIGTPDNWQHGENYRGFRFTFNSSRPMCGGSVTTSEGYLVTPGYPRKTSVRYCQWFITVPNKMRRIRLELLDSDTESHRIAIFNDLGFQSYLQVIPNKNNTSNNTRVFESSGPTLALYIWLDTSLAQHRFKAKFSSDEPALCGGTITGAKGQIRSLDFDRSYTCKWHYNSNDLTNSSQYKTLYVNVQVNSSSTRARCSTYEPRLQITTLSSVYYTRVLCGNTETSYRIPSTEMDLTATKNKGNLFNFNLQWKLQPCGGVINVNEIESNILDIPSYTNDTLDCAWIVKVSLDTRIQMKIEGSFKLDCDNEFLQIGQINDDKTSLIADYCRDRVQDVPLVTSYRSILLQYHSNIQNNTSLKVMVKSVTNHCGGVILDYQPVFQSPNYPNHYEPNLECTWEIRTGPGNMISLNFIERFAIEDRTNCTKDAVIVYDWKDDEFVEIARVCGRTIPPTFNSTFNRMKVVLRSDASVELDGFRAQWSPVCGGKLTATNKEQFLTSPGYPYTYLPREDCNYVISGNGKKINLKFLEFDLEGTYPSCEYDNFTIKANSDFNYLLSTYCESVPPPSSHEYDKIEITFKTDSYIQRKGFKISYKVYECGNRVTSPTVISTIKPSGTYDVNENCTWPIEAPTDKVVVIKFQEIGLEKSSGCYNDFLAVFEGLTIDINKRLALWCGQLHGPLVLRSSNNTMLLQFKTDSSLNYIGFKANVYFSYSYAVGCGGHIDLTASSTHTLKSPLIGGSVVYENFLDCQWTVKAPIDYVIQIEFKSFHIAPCAGVNQTALGINKCDCDYVEIKDDYNPNNFARETYCGHAELPPQLTSSGNIMSVKLSTDGEIQSSGFEALLYAKPAVCRQTVYTVSHSVQTVKSPGFESGVVPRNLHCKYIFDTAASEYEILRLTVKYLDLLPGYPDENQCNRDKLTITSIPAVQNVSVGKDFILNGAADYFLSNSYIDYESQLRQPDQYTFCGSKKDIDLYLTGSSIVRLQTAPESGSSSYKGMEIQAAFVGICGRNYTELHGRIKTAYAMSSSTSGKGDCYTLITAPANYTISLYFLHVMPDYWNEQVYLDVHDGDKTTAPRLTRIQTTYEDESPVFSTGRYLLLHNHYQSSDVVSFDLNYVQTDKGRGCGGKIHNLVGKVTSPLYPAVYREINICEWELETTPGTRLRLHFTVFDLGRLCDQNYVKLVDRSGKVISTYCAETPADYISNDNYVKIVFTTTKNNSGTGWVADFIAVL